MCNKEKKKKRKKKKKNDEFWRCAVGQGTGGKLSGMRSFKLGQSRRNAGSWARGGGRAVSFPRLVSHRGWPTTRSRGGICRAIHTEPFQTDPCCPPSVHDQIPIPFQNFPRSQNQSSLRNSPRASHFTRWMTLTSHVSLANGIGISLSGIQFFFPFYPFIVFRH